MTTFTISLTSYDPQGQAGGSYEFRRLGPIGGDLNTQPQHSARVAAHQRAARVAADPREAVNAPFLPLPGTTEGLAADLPVFKT